MEALRAEVVPNRKPNSSRQKQCSGAIKNMSGRQLSVHQLDGVQLSVSGGSWMTSTGKVFHWSDCSRKRLTVHACVALDLPVAGFESSGVDDSWLEID